MKKRSQADALRNGHSKPARDISPPTQNGHDKSKHAVQNGHSLSLSESSGHGSPSGANSGRPYELVSYAALPPFLHDNEYLLHSHRPALHSTAACLKSVFEVHSETWNIWTHLIGAVITIILGFYYLTQVADDWAHKLVFAVFFVGATFCMGASASYHVLICHSEPVCSLMAKFDYCGVIALITTSFVPWLHFAFYCEPHIRLFYTLFTSSVGILAASFAVQDRFRTPPFRWLRLGLFSSLALTGVIPMIHYWKFMNPAISVDDLPLDWLSVACLQYMIGGLMYGVRVPERIFPGSCDIVCQSHQILHICVVGGVLACHVGVSRLAALRLQHYTDCGAQ